ncbi:hypothetical protein BDF22DRAFT_696097 [Syncephalis plumigaleata]|nr:hypothetical protein BDF22DRAFT_696097 [Syncephalis plumigaleata]
MPSIDFSNATDMAWLTNAKHLWGIPLHPLGEMNMLDYYVNEYNAGNRGNELAGVRFQIINGAILMYIVLHNTKQAINLLNNRPRAIISWCCFIPCITGILTATIFIMLELGLYFTCRHAVWSLSFGISVSNFCNTMILLQKAYLISCRQKWIIYVSVLPMLLQLSYAICTTFTGHVRILLESGCTVFYSYYTIWYWFAIAFPLNTVFSCIFCYHAYRLYRQYGSDAWKRLTRDGIQTMCLAAICNIVFCFLVISQAFGPRSDLLIPTDWLIVNTMLIRKFNQHRDTNNFSSRTKTHKILSTSQTESTV